MLKTVNEYLQGVYKVTPNTKEVCFATAVDQELNGIAIELTTVEDEVFEAIVLKRRIMCANLIHKGIGSV